MPTTDASCHIPLGSRNTLLSPHKYTHRVTLSVWERCTLCLRKKTLPFLSENSRVGADYCCGKHRIPGTQPTAVGGAVLCRMPAWGHPSSSAEGLTVIAVLNALFSGWGPGPLDLQRPRGWWCCPACPSSADVSVGRLTLLPSPCHGMETAAFCGPCLNPALPTVCSGGF